MNRFTTRYGAPQQNPKPCSTPTCRNTAANLAGRCWRCANNLRRHAHCLQEVPLDTELAPLIRRAETQRARHQHLDVDKLEAHYRAVVDSCRGKASPSYREHGKLTFNVTEREACAVVRDCAEGEGMTFVHCLDLMTAMHLLRIERPRAFRSDDFGVERRHVPRGNLGGLPSPVQCRPQVGEDQAGSNPTDDLPQGTVPPRPPRSRPLSDGCARWRCGCACTA